MKHLQTLLTLLPLLFTFSVAVAGITNTPSDFPSPTPAPTPETPLKLPAIIAAKSTPPRREATAAGW